jgi:hypothetical protein
MRKLLIFLAMTFALPALADHPGDRLDEVMSRKEPALEPVDRHDWPRTELRGAAGGVIELEGLSDQVAVLSFLPHGCGAPCARQQQILEAAREGGNASAMREMVTFLLVTDDPAPAAEPANGNMLRATSPEPTTAVMEELARLSSRQEQEPMVHVIARGGRHAGIFHGTGFKPINLILYVNGLTNAH